MVKLRRRLKKLLSELLGLMVIITSAAVEKYENCEEIFMGFCTLLPEILYKLLRKANTYSSNTDASVERVDCGGDSLSRLGELQLCRSIWHLKTMSSLWPSVEDLDDIQTK